MAKSEAPPTLVRAFQWDLARQVERLDFLKKLLPRYAAWGYQELYLHLEDAIHYPSLPGIGREDAYTHAALGELVAAATRCGIRVVPIVNLLGHTQYLIKHPDLRDLNELRDERGGPRPQGQVCPLHPRLPEIAGKLLHDLAPYCTAGKVHVGLDESFHLGKCPRCREEVARIGLGGHFAGHVNRLHQQVTELGLQMGIWADMLYFVPEAIPLLPAGITAYDWYYYPFRRKPKVEFYNFAERDLHPALKKQGIAYYGCPMNGAFRHEPLPVYGDRLANIRSWWQRCQNVGAEGLLITSWEANRLALETATVVDAAAASLWLEPGPDDATTMLTRGLARLGVGPPARAQARALLAADDHAFSGYARWQINDRWDVLAGTEPLKRYDTDRRFYTRLHAAAYSWNEAFAAALGFRLYLAERDVFVRQAARDVFRLRRLLARSDQAGLEALHAAMGRNADDFAPALDAGIAAARAMRRHSRDRRRPGQNEALLRKDRARLQVWRRWLTKISHDPTAIGAATPVCGAWQLQLMVHNFTPAVQKVIVEQRVNDEAWQEIASRYTIEFRAEAARSHSRIVRELTVPIPHPDCPLRLRVGGVGEVMVSRVTLTDGIQVYQALPPKRRKRLGLKAPQAGFPDLTAADSRSAWLIRWL
ncbi:Glycosyl hydrolase family 20, catalytic domain [Lacunisphaera limnophila]|uniref:Glycosyl hydrolase family 20, catalytic domain n=1 Tax=Lacunisphaera limnophila TaxID=1838286 RepID=A0A1D8ASG1_9BACT|nr:family 20 glycosylhydrolase [Lacunisphaera limnophila]AOS43800.1 Glycosyl hydrolase family 20, catalytic domain [Lacunisphaera limnophila]